MNTPSRASTWIPTRLRYEARLNPSTPTRIRSAGDTEVTFISMDAIGEYGRVQLDVARPVSELLNGYSYFENNDVLIAKVTPCFENGKAALIQELPKGVGFGTTEVTVLRPATSLESRFLFYLTAEDQFKQGGIASMTGAGGLRRVPDSYVRDFKLKLPTAGEQRQIADYLDAQTAKIDLLVEKQEQLIKTLAERRQAVISHAITKGLDPNVPLKDSGIYWLGSVPETWQIRRFGHVTRVNGGQVDPRLDKYRDMTLIAPNHIEQRTGRLLTRETAADQGADSGKYFVQKGQVIYSKIRPALRKAAIANEACLCSADMYGIDANQELIMNEFLLVLILSQPFTQYAIDASMRVAMPKLNRETLAAGALWFPSLKEQSEILVFLDRETTQIDALSAKAREMINVLKERRQALISAAVTGKIDVRGLA